MPTVEFKIGNKSYDIACDPGEEIKIKNLAKNLNVRVGALSKVFGGASDGFIMAATALMMEDEIRLLKESKNVVNSNTSTLPNETEQADKINNAIIDAIEPITQYIETLANRLENR